MRDYDWHSYSRQYNNGFLIGWFEADAKPAFEARQVPKDWLKHIKKDFKHFCKYLLHRDRI